MSHRAIETEGITLGLTAYGDPLADRLVLFFPPTPGAGGFDPDPLLTGRWGLHLLVLDRPGYGASPPLPPGREPSVADLVDAVAGFLRRSERVANDETQATFGSVGVVGWGSGGVYAVVLAARHPDLVDRLALIDTPRPAVPGPWRTRPVSLEGLRISDDDPNLNLPGVRDRLEEMLKNAGLQGAAGVQGDADAIRAADWAEDVGCVRAPTLVVRGNQDPLVEDADVRWFERHLANVQVRTAAGTGMLAIVQDWEAILQHVAPRHGSIKASERDSGTVQIERDPRAWSASGTA